MMTTSPAAPPPDGASYPASADQSVTVWMSERVSYEITLTHRALAALLGVDLAHLPDVLADPARWSATYGPAGPDTSALLDAIDQDQHRTGAEDREWGLR